MKWRVTDKLYYNKDLFDKFGTAYPKDGLNWDETYDLARKLTRNDGGQQYQGMIVAFDNRMLFSQLSAPFVDPKTNKSTFLSNPEWQMFAANLVRFRQIPGNENQDNTLFTTKVLAAMFVATSDQQMEKAGALTVLNDPQKRKEFGKEIPWLTRKINMEAMFQDKIAPAFTLTPYDSLAQSALNRQLTDLAAGKVADLNTALRQATEQADKAIQEQIDKTKK